MLPILTPDFYPKNTLFLRKIPLRTKQKESLAIKSGMALFHSGDTFMAKSISSILGPGYSGFLEMHPGK